MTIEERLAELEERERSRDERAARWAALSPEERLAAIPFANTPLGLPYPSDYQTPADSPLAFQQLATATDTQLAGRSVLTHHHDGTYSAVGHGHNYAPASHTHPYTQVGVGTGLSAVQNAFPSNAAVQVAIPHNLGRAPLAAVATAVDLAGNPGDPRAYTTTIYSWDAVNVICNVRATSTSSGPPYQVSVIVVG